MAKKEPFLFCFCFPCAESCLISKALDCYQSCIFMVFTCFHQLKVSDCVQMKLIRLSLKQQSCGCIFLCFPRCVFVLFGLRVLFGCTLCGFSMI